jgi:hypothetical protein
VLKKLDKDDPDIRDIFFENSNRLNEPFEAPENSYRVSFKNVEAKRTIHFERAEKNPG